MEKIINMEKKEHKIIIVANTEGRLNDLKPLFEKLHANGQGKYSKNVYYCIKSSVFLRDTSTKEAILFNRLQQENHNTGVETSCYCLNLSV